MNPPKMIRAHKDTLLHTHALFFNVPGYVLLFPPIALKLTTMAAIKLREIEESLSSTD